MNRLRNKQLEGTILVCFAPQRWTAAVRRPPMRRPCFTLQEATMGIWSNYFVGHSAAVFEVLLHNSPLQAPPTTSTSGELAQLYHLKGRT